MRRRGRGGEGWVCFEGGGRRESGRVKGRGVVVLLSRELFAPVCEAAVCRILQLTADSLANSSMILRQNVSES